MLDERQMLSEPLKLPLFAPRQTFHHNSAFAVPSMRISLTIRHSFHSSRVSLIVSIGAQSAMVIPANGWKVDLEGSGSKGKEPVAFFVTQSD